MTFAIGFLRLHNKPAIIIAANILNPSHQSGHRASAVFFAGAAGAVVLGPAIPTMASSALRGRAETEQIRALLRVIDLQPVSIRRALSPQAQVS
ncbi:MAG: hypothetical protein EOR57_32380 [Mesorhizobium sp.]|uniref:hypothetical protein n=1 Tax=Mesorhizobium sp. TaxID=1871066 RepID=UPI000FE80279|nr:hypothetical protein [Mesorhizobium sp.]RWL14127.1 MAG: hypothetical protein EOR57_32380 [Mesorhizobium sp.]